MARRAPPARQGGVGEAVQEDVPLHRRRDRGRVPDEHRLSAGRPRRELSRLQEDRAPEAGVDANREEPMNQPTKSATGISLEGVDVASLSSLSRGLIGSEVL